MLSRIFQNNRFHGTFIHCELLIMNDILFITANADSETMLGTQEAF